jgi:hypothetical protein
MKDLLRDGYTFASERYGSQEYNRLKEHFPNIFKIKMHGKVIFFLEGKENIATKAFLDTTSKRIIGYQELKQVTKTFKADLSINEKKMFIRRNQEKNKRKIKGSLNASRSILKEAQAKFDDFLRRFLPSEVLEGLCSTNGTEPYTAIINKNNGATMRDMILGPIFYCTDPGFQLIHNQLQGIAKDPQGNFLFTGGETGLIILKVNIFTIP